jgi:hypothetical protein
MKSRKNDSVSIMKKKNKELLKEITLAEKQLANGKEIAHETVKQKFLKGEIVR